MYAAQPHVIHHTTVVQPNSIPSAIYPAPVAAPRTNGVAMGMVAGTTMAMSAGKEGTLPVLWGLHRKIPRASQVLPQPCRVYTVHQLVLLTGYGSFAGKNAVICPKS